MKSNKWSSALKLGALAVAFGSSVGLVGSALAVAPVNITQGPWQNPWPGNYSQAQTLTKGLSNVATVTVITGNPYRASYEAKTSPGNVANKYKGEFFHYCTVQSPGKVVFGPDVAGKPLTNLECVFGWLGFDLLINGQAKADNS